MPPTLVFVPDFWEGPSVFEPLIRALSQHARPAPMADFRVAPLRSTGTQSPGNPCMVDDADAIRRVVEPLVRAGRRVLVVAHGAAGFLASDAVKDLEVGGTVGRKAAAAGAGTGAGVLGLVFIAAALFAPGCQPPALPFMDFQGGRMYCKKMDRVLFNGMPRDLAAIYKPKMSYQPAEDYFGPIRHAGWRNIPSWFLVCENDACLPPDLQRYMATAADCRIWSLPLGHLGLVYAPEQIAEKIQEVIRSEGN